MHYYKIPLELDSRSEYKNFTLSHFTDRWQRSQGALLTQSIEDGVSVESVRDNWTEIVNMDSGDFPTSNQEATMDLVGKMRPLTEETKTTENGPLNMVIYLHTYG